MRRIRSLAAQTPALVLSLLAIVLSLGGGAYASTQLAAESPPAAGHAVARSASGVSWHQISLRNGWVSSNSTFASGNPKVSKKNGIVYLSGSLNQPSPASAEFAVLAKKYRPTHNMWITVYTFGDSSGTLRIGADGTMEAFSPGSCSSGNTAQCYTSLATVSYPVNS